jgi:uncharacterized iron-regulated membrane protein
MSFRRVVLVTHRWLGLLSAPILIVVGATGVILTVDFESVPSLDRVGRYASALHQQLAFGRIGLGRIGHRIVLVATLVAVIMEVGGLVLWWKRKTLAVRLRNGWWCACFDLHHLAGVVCLPVMLLGAGTALAMFIYPPPENAELYRMFRQWHVGRFPLPLKVIYVLATLGFVVQGVTGFVVWWKPKA